MKKIKKTIYPILKILLPLILILIISIYVSSFFTLSDYDGSWFKVSLSKITFNHPRRVAFILLILIQLFVVRHFNKDKEFAPSDIYGDYYIIIYNLADWLLGYKTVNLKMKPIPLQFKLLHENRFNCVDDSEYDSKNYGYEVIYMGKCSNKTEEINIIVADTYEIDKSKLPKSKIKNYTIKFNRKGPRGVRTNSKELINLLIKEVQKNKKYCKKYNLFLSTPASVNKSIYSSVFQTGQRDGFELNIYQQDNENEFKFKDKPTKIKC